MGLEKQLDYFNDWRGKMARPERHDVDYFPFFAKRGKTLNILQSKFGLEGIGFFTNLMRFLALTPDHYYCIKDETDKLNFFAEIGISDEDKGNAMIELMVKTGKLDKELWEKHQVIACQAFLDSIEDAYKKRGNKIITIEQIKARFEENESSGVSTSVNPEKVSENTHTAGFTVENEDNNPQRILKDTKVKESKEKNINSDPQKLFLDIWQHTPNVFNSLGRIEQPKEWVNFWEKSNTTCEQVKVAMDNFIADVGSRTIERRFIPATPDRFVLKGWITKCQERFMPKATSPPSDSVQSYQKQKKSL